MANYVKRIRKDQVLGVAGPENYDNADILVEVGGSIATGRLIIANHVRLSSLSSSTIRIKDLSCLDAEIFVSSSSTVIIENFHANGRVVVEVKDASTLTIQAGNLGVIAGSVRRSSTGVCRAAVQSDLVITESASTWVR